MIKLEFVVCAEKLIKEADNELYSAINILEDISVETFPTFLPKLAVLLVCSKSEVDGHEYEVMFTIGCNGKEIYKRPQKIIFRDKKKANLVINIEKFAMAEPGEIVFKFDYSDQHVEYKISMNQRVNPSEPTITTNPDA